MRKTSWNFVIRLFTCAVAFSTIFSGGLDAEVMDGVVSTPAGVPFEILEVPPPEVGDNNHDVSILYAFDEQQNVLLTDDLVIGSQVIPAGTKVDSHYVFWDPASTTRVEGTVFFDGEVLGVMETRAELNASDSLLGLPGINYHPEKTLRGLEPGDDFVSHVDDFILLNFRAGDPGDNVRVVTLSPPDETQIVAHVRFTQGVDSPPGVDLVAKKSLAVRAFPRVSLPGEAGTAVEAELCITNMLIDEILCLYETGTAFGLDKEFSVEERLDEVDSIDFEIRGADLEYLTGNVIFQLTLTSPSSRFEDFFFQAEKNFQDSKLLVVQPFEIRLALDTNPRSFGNPSAESVSSIGEYLNAAYPVADNKVLTPRSVRYTFLDYEIEWKDTETEDWWHRTQGQRFERRLFRMWGSLDHRLKAEDLADVIGVVVLPNRARGNQQTLNGYGGYHFPGSNIAYVQDNGSPFTAYAIAHELGHYYGLGDEYLGGAYNWAVNPPPFIGNPPNHTYTDGNRHGSFITSEDGAYSFEPSLTFDEAGAFFHSFDFEIWIGFMGGIVPNPVTGEVGVPFWATREEYHHIRQQLAIMGERPAQVMSKQGSQYKLNATHVRNIAYVGGMLRKSNGQWLGEIETVFPFESAAALPQVTPGGWTVTLRDASHSIIGEEAFDASFVVESLGGLANDYKEIDFWPFGLLIEFPEHAEAVELLSPDQVLLDQRFRSSNAPEIEIDHVNIDSTGQISVSWIATDIDGDELEYSTGYSPDGATFELITEGEADSQVSFAPPIDLQQLLDLGVFFEISANDGFNTTTLQQRLDFGGTLDAVRLVSYQTQGPFIPNFCNRAGCYREKTHTISAENLTSTHEIAVDFEIVVHAVPDQTCTVNGMGEGQAIEVDSEVVIQPGRRDRARARLTFECANPVSPGSESKFVLEARVIASNGFDLTMENNARVAEQAVR